MSSKMKVHNENGEMFESITSTGSVHKKNLINLILKASYRHDTSKIFSDFVEMSAIALSNAFDKKQFDNREARWFDIRSKYTREEISLFHQMFWELIDALEQETADVLGEIFMRLNLGNASKAQCFTPYSLCKLLAKVNVAHVKEVVSKKGYCTVLEPCAGSGSMIIAFADEMYTVGMNYQQQMVATCIDLDIRAVHMTYVQMSLLNIPAIIIHGNSLAVEEYSRWYTPAYIMGDWSFLKRLDRLRSIIADISENIHDEGIPAIEKSIQAEGSEIVTPENEDISVEEVDPFSVLSFFQTSGDNSNTQVLLKTEKSTKPVKGFKRNQMSLFDFVAER